MDWSRLMAIGFGVLRLSPAQFWAMTPKEFACASGLARHRHGAVPDRAVLEALMARFPDQGGKDRDE
ncbi:rcc01693 family protein [Nitratireductor sp. StC3]|uniref:rcc01693 family protein n=1 Tax=Nitratireductor sp. StC3 TaxID=2126741 RepID=UPI000D0E1910|nr:rcc01693 family protein [Nitratireductor sp. StC3]PSM18146.1 phage tail assembly chaperone [Nitratireductor sp. StC3]